MSRVTCPACGARNAPAAPWCTQCYEPLGAGRDAGPSDPDPRPEDAATPEPLAEDAPTPGPPAGDAATPGDPPRGPAHHGAATAGGRDVRQDEDGGVEWRCAVCDGWSPLEAPTCTVCGAGRTGFGDDRATAVPDERRTVLWSALVPGLGHVLAGRVGSGVARAVLGLGWLVGGLLLLGAAVRAGSGYLSGVVLLAGAAAVWALTVLDARSLARGAGEQRLDGRTLLWLVVGVTCLLVMALMVGAWRLAG